MVGLIFVEGLGVSTVGLDTVLKFSRNSVGGAVIFTCLVCLLCKTNFMHAIKPNIAIKYKPTVLKPANIGLSIGFVTDGMTIKMTIKRVIVNIADTTQLPAIAISSKEDFFERLAI